VLPGDPLRFEFQHVAMQRGAMVIEIQVANINTGDSVMKVESLVDQASTAYVFAGQGSQSKGMGMELYKKSPHAKALWDRGDAILRNKFGFSILDLVRNNPKELLVSFGGKRGRKVRENYLALTKRIGSVRDGGDVTCIVDGLHLRSGSHTFSEGKGLLFSTQFSQPAL
jgi:fatty acid synthase subunit beta